MATTAPSLEQFATITAPRSLEESGLRARHRRAAAAQDAALRRRAHRRRAGRSPRPDLPRHRAGHRPPEGAAPVRDRRRHVARAAVVPLPHHAARPRARGHRISTATCTRRRARADRSVPALHGRRSTRRAAQSVTRADSEEGVRAPRAERPRARSARAGDQRRATRSSSTALPATARPSSRRHPQPDARRHLDPVRDRRRRQPRSRCSIPVNHDAVPDGPKETALESTTEHDRRWIRCRRPLVMVGGELTLEQLELTYNPAAGFYRAPMQLARQRRRAHHRRLRPAACSPQALLNRWILPLESRIDFLTLQSGQKVEMPFMVLPVFATNIKPAELVDEAFLRRIQYKVFAENPTPDDYRADLPERAATNAASTTTRRSSTTC